MSQTHLTNWIEDADARGICRDAAFLTGVEQKHYLHLGAVITRVTEWWHHNVSEQLLPVHSEQSARH